MEADTKNDNAITINLQRVLQMIPHRYPFLMIDRVVDVVRNQSAVGVKNVSVNEHYFQGHFPGHPVMPGVLIIESMAQTAAVCAMASMISTPGITGSDGKWPWKNGSLMVTFLMPTALLPVNTSSTRSIIRKG